MIPGCVRCRMVAQYVCPHCGKDKKQKSNLQQHLGYSSRAKADSTYTARQGCHNPATCGHEVCAKFRAELQAKQQATGAISPPSALPSHFTAVDPAVPDLPLEALDVLASAALCMPCDAGEQVCHHHCIWPHPCLVGWPFRVFRPCSWTRFRGSQYRNLLSQRLS